MDRLLQDLRFGLRLLWKDRGFTLTAVATLAVSVAGNVAIFTLVDTVLLRPLPYPAADRLVLVHNSYPKAGVDEASNSVPDYFDRRQMTDVFEEVGIFEPRGLTVGGRGDAERVLGMAATPSVLRMLGATAYRGRTLTEGDAQPGREHEVVLSYAAWARLFGGADGAIGQSLRLNGEPYTVVGVLPASFRYVEPGVALWIPAAFAPEDRADDQRHSNNWQMLARLRPGTTVQGAQARIDALNAHVIDIIPSIRQVLIDAGYHTVVGPWQAQLVAPVRATLYLLWGGVLFVLLIGCVNIANLSSIRSTGRLRELATRHAMGAGVGRIARQMLTEGVLLAAIGGVAGLVLARWALAGAGALGFDELPAGSAIAIDGRVALFALGLVLAVGVAIGLTPVLMVRRANLAQVFREEGRAGTASRGARLARRALVTAQVAFAMVLLCGAGLLLVSFQRVLAIDPGFEPRGILIGRLSPPASRYADDPSLRQFWARVIERVSRVPGVTVAGATSTLPLTGDVSDSVIFPEGYRPTPGQSLISPAQLRVTPGYFATMGMRPVRGRVFDARDTEQSSPVAVVDEQLARKFWPGQDPIGRRMYQPQSNDNILATDAHTRWITVVGVVRNVRLGSLVAGPNDRIGAYYFAQPQDPARSMALAIRTTGDPTALAATVRRELTALDPELPFYGVRSMEAQVTESLVGRRTPMLLAVGFAGVALLLAAIGIYGALAYQVAQRAREIGIRMALGASAPAVVGMVLREGAAMVAIGLGIGIAGALALRRALDTQLYGISASDPRVLAAVAATLAAVGLVACLLPARTAAKTDPVKVLSAA